jgi:hypothetical protein
MEKISNQQMEFCYDHCGLKRRKRSATEWQRHFQTSNHITFTNQYKNDHLNENLSTSHTENLAIVNTEHLAVVNGVNLEEDTDVFNYNDTDFFNYNDTDFNYGDNSGQNHGSEDENSYFSSADDAFGYESSDSEFLHETEEDGSDSNEEPDFLEHVNNYKPFKNFTHTMLYLFSTQARLSRTNFRKLIKILKHPKFSILEIKKTSEWHLAPIPSDIETNTVMAFRPFKVFFMFIVFLSLDYFH